MVERLDGLTLAVRPAEDWELAVVTAIVVVLVVLLALALTAASLSVRVLREYERAVVFGWGG